MTDDDTGWSLVGWHVDGPFRDRSFIGDDGGTPVTRFDGNPLEIIDTLNQGRFASFEINKILQRQYLHNGGVIEPLIGLRYTQFKDSFTHTGTYQTFDLNADGVLDTDLLVRSKGVIENNMLGAQVGCRILKDVGHWQFNTQLRAFAMQNWEILESRNTSSSTSTAGLQILAVPTYADSHDQATVYGGELKMDFAYKFTRDISLNFGFVLIDYGIGVGRAGVNNPTFNQNTFVLNSPAVTAQQQDLFMGGLTFGFNINH